MFSAGKEITTTWSVSIGAEEGGGVGGGAAGESIKRFRWAESKLAALSPALVSRRVAFWLNQGVGLKQETCLPDRHFPAELAGMCRQVELFGHQPLKFDLELPGLKLLDARDHLTEEKALDLLGQGWKVQHLGATLGSTSDRRLFPRLGPAVVA